MFVIVNLQVHLNKLECHGKVHLFQLFNSNCETGCLMGYYIGQCGH